MLATMLSRAAIDVRVAIGSRDGRHAWCVARIGDAQFILESTKDLAADESPDLLPVQKATEEYFPEFLFDPNRLYFRVQRGSEPKRCTDYWSDQTWITVDPIARR